jgi:hypothetical protein
LTPPWSWGPDIPWGPLVCTIENRISASLGKYFVGTTFQNEEKLYEIPQNIPNGC